ncbi:protein N-lysine methyltransferase METTL21A-like [Pistacia vera]|uniref:protein N-lysine methyltransferase METTL21A-like n=1 Tax=Pistacia vera TaxID=55513 RepID=UPI00126385A9|nr:protein N-lysine methyltransferase METTL21A-like [Pistacia vera]
MGIREIEVAGHKLIIHEQDNVYDSLTGRALTGAWLWDSAVILAHYMATHLDFQTKSVLELGAGAGLPGLTAARLGASRVVLTDVKPLLPGLTNNVKANGLGDRVEVRELVWGSEESKQSEVGEFDFVLMSDVFFYPEDMVGLGKTLKSVCYRSNTWICAVSEVRPWTGDCLNELVNQGFRVTELESKLGSGSSGEGKDNLDAFAVFQLISPLQENCHETDIFI